MPTLIEISQQVRWQDVVDVLLLTFIVYRVYTWLRGTMALRIGLGLLVLAVAAFAADKIGLLLTAYVLQALGAVAALVVVVIFRDEIRRALGHVNPLRWWRERRAAPVDRSTFATLARAALALSERGIGAILVLPRQDRVDEHLTGGTVLDAVPSAELLEAVFHTGSPIHDGAVVVADGRVRLAGAFLPISTATHIPDHMGSRHRAALGLTEHCDAVVVTVSEERGQVCVVVDGRVSSPLADAGALTRHLDQLMGSTAAEPGAAPRRGWAKGLAFCASFALVVTAWYLVVAGPGTVVVRTATVELRNLPPDVEAGPPRPQEVDLHVRGPRALIGELAPADISAWVDLGDGKLGQRRVRVEAEVPVGFRVVDIAPRRVGVRLRRAAE